jgi:chemotaxis signal transduction protein
MSENPWLRFEVGGQAYALPLSAVVEVTGALTPHLIPRIPLEIGGIVNVRGEPLPAVDGGAVLTGSPVKRHRYVLVMERGNVRIGVLVGDVRRIQRELALSLEDAGEADSGLVQWVNQDDTALGLVDPEGLFERATLLLTDPRSKTGGQEPWQTGF